MDATKLFFCEAHFLRQLLFLLGRSLLYVRIRASSTSVRSMHAISRSSNHCILNLKRSFFGSDAFSPLTCSSNTLRTCSSSVSIDGRACNISSICVIGFRVKTSQVGQSKCFNHRTFLPRVKDQVVPSWTLGRWLSPFLLFPCSRRIQERFLLPSSLLPDSSSRQRWKEWPAGQTTFDNHLLPTFDRRVRWRRILTGGASLCKLPV